jgi:hypothetical protein
VSRLQPQAGGAGLAEQQRSPAAQQAAAAEARRREQPPRRLGGDGEDPAQRDAGSLALRRLHDGGGACPLQPIERETRGYTCALGHAGRAAAPTGSATVANAVRSEDA